MKQFLILFSAISLCAAPPTAKDFMGFEKDPKIAVQNAILAKVNGKTISVLDVKKKMDVFFYQNYPQLADSAPARLQFYETSWRSVLIDMINSELMIAEALEKEIKLTDGEVRETLEGRFGPNVMRTLDKIDLTYDEAWKMTKDELIVQKMSWWFINMKALASITPQDIRNAYHTYLEKNPPYSELQYRVISIRMDKPNDQFPETLSKWLSDQKKSPIALEKEIKQFNTPEITVTISSEFNTKMQELSDTHKAALESLNVGSYSKPSFQVNRLDKKGVYRIFYLIDKKEYAAPSFESMANRLQEELKQKAVAQEAQSYLSKLRKRYGFDAENAVRDDLHPFSIQ